MTVVGRGNSARKLLKERGKLRSVWHEADEKQMEWIYYRLLMRKRGEQTSKELIQRQALL
jgi:hypothetical protein